MIITKRVKLDNFNYYIYCDCVYRDGQLFLRNYKKDYYDGGDLSILIEEVEKHYKDSYKRFDSYRWFMTDVLYIYDNIPFISGIGDVYSSKGEITSTTYISKEEIDDYIKENNIKMKDDSKFCLADGRTWNVK